MQDWMRAAVWGLGVGVLMYCAGVVWDSDREKLSDWDERRKWLGAFIGGAMGYCIALMYYYYVG